MYIAIDRGHGITTPGKRSPILANGKVMKEWEFNESVARKIEVLLKYNNFKTLYIAPTEADTPLKARTNFANKEKVDLFISIHANAMTGTWNNAHGIESYVYINADLETVRAGRYIHDSLITATGQYDRGLKQGDLHVLRETTMLAVLVECGFMDNEDDIKLLLNEDYRWQCARGIVKGICKYYDVEYKEETEQQKHWAKKEYERLSSWGINFTEEDFDDKMTRGEFFAATVKVLEYIDKKYERREVL